MKAKVKCLANLATHVPQALVYSEDYSEKIVGNIDFFFRNFHKWCDLEQIFTKIKSAPVSTVTKN